MQHPGCKRRGQATFAMEFYAAVPQIALRGIAEREHLNYHEQRTEAADQLLEAIRRRYGSPVSAVTESRAFCQAKAALKNMLRG